MAATETIMAIIVTNPTLKCRRKPICRNEIKYIRKKKTQTIYEQYLE